MSKHWLEIENFSDDEVTEMFNALCVNALGKQPADIKKSLLGMKTAKNATMVTLSHLMTLIEKEGLEISFKVHYLKEDKVLKKPEVVEAPKLDIGLKVDPIAEAMKEQEQTIIVANRNFTEVGVAKVNTPMSSDMPSDNPSIPKFDPGAIPNFNI
jgi:hypothetical protein